MSDSKVRLAWIVAFISSVILLVGGLGAMCVDYAVKGGIELIDDHFLLIFWTNILSLIFAWSAYGAGQGI